MKFIILQLFGGRGSGSSNIYLHYGRQGKHWTWHNNYQPNKSPITVSPQRIQELVSKYKGTGKKVENGEIVDFGEIIGTWIDDITGKSYNTTRGKIHWMKDGGYHVVPAKPIEL